MTLYPGFYNEFQCIGSHCKNTCCAGWNISIDETTYQAYQQLRGRFGQFVRLNLIQGEQGTSIRMAEGNLCPFLNKDRLCQLHLQFGSGFLSNTCRKFPRKQVTFEDFSMKTLSLSCEQVLRLLYCNTAPVTLIVEEDQTSCLPDRFRQHIQEITQYLSFCIDLLQDSDIPLGSALGALLHTGNTVSHLFKHRTYDTLPDTITQTRLIFSDLEQTKQTISHEEFRQVTDQLCFVVIDTFCQIAKEMNYPKHELFIWDSSFFDLSDPARKEALCMCRQKQNKSDRHRNFIRHLAAHNMVEIGMALCSDSEQDLFTKKMCLYLILIEYLPLTWRKSCLEGSADYLSRLAGICRIFDQRHDIEQIVLPIIHDLLHPDILSYTMTLMDLFDF